MKVLVTGAGGFLGKSVTKHLLERGHHARAIVRPASILPEWGSNVEIVRADLRDHQDPSIFEGIDAVLHLAAATSGNEDAQFASTVVATERFLNTMAKSSVKRLIHVSSLVVYDWMRAVGTMDENSPLLSSPYEMGGYTIAKIWQERTVTKFAKDNGWDLTIMRPGFIWGTEHAEIAGMGRRLGKAYVLFGPFTRLPLCHVDNCALCLVTAAEKSDAIGQTFNVIDGDDIRVWRYVREYAARSGRRGFMLPVPYFVGFGIARFASFVSNCLFGRKGKLPSLLSPRRFESQFKPIRFSNQKLKQKLAWSAPLGFDQCLKLTYVRR